VPSVILIHPSVWPQYADVTDRQTGQTGQRSKSAYSPLDIIELFSLALTVEALQGRTAAIMIC